MDELTELRANIQQLSAIVNQQSQRIVSLTDSQIEIQAALNKLGAALTWEYVSELKEWVSKQKLSDLRENPRGLRGEKL